MPYKIEEIEGVGPDYAQKLAKAAPPPSVIDGWIKQASGIEPKIKH